MRCVTCGDKITKENSYKIDCQHEDRICRQCVRDGRINVAIDILEHNDEAKK